MSTFSYKARDEAGRVVFGKMNALSSSEVADRLNSSGYIPTEITQEQETVFSKDLLASFRRVSLRDRIIITSQLANSINAGITLMHALEVITAETKNPILNQVLKEVIKDLKSGSSLYAALEKHPKIFFGYYVSMVQIGEMSGRLGEILERLSQYMEKQEDLNQKISSALAYPTFLVILATGAIIFLLTTIMPKFIKLFKESNIPLPTATAIFLNISNFITHYYYVIIIFIVIVAVLFRSFLETKYGRLQFDSFKLKVPIIGNVFRKIYISRFVSALALLYNSGVTILNSLIVLEEIVGNQVLVNVIRNMRTTIKEGHNITAPLKQSGMFPGDMIMMVNAGEESGQLGDMLKKISSFYDRDVEYAIKRLMTLIEPALLLIMGSVVGFMAMAIIIPIFRLRAGIGAQ